MFNSYFHYFYYTNFFLHVADKRPEDANYLVDVLTRCVVNKEVGSKKTMKIAPLNERGEPAVVSLPLSQVIVNFVPLNSNLLFTGLFSSIIVEKALLVPTSFFFFMDFFFF